MNLISLVYPNVQMEFTFRFVLGSLQAFRPLEAILIIFLAFAVAKDPRDPARH